MKYDVVIGCEVHVQLLTETKAFCSCRNTFGGEPNTRLCPVCTGLPGALPVANQTLVEYAVLAGLAMNCTIVPVTKFDRKNYIYPDMPKGYQISQFDMPICEKGFLEIDTDGGLKKIRIIRIHMEEDAGKNIHTEDRSGLSHVDLNRAGTPLLEIVSEPDIRSPDDAVAYVQSIKHIMEYLKISDCNMEEGSLRCDANINLWVYEGDKKYATPIVEIKNMNSFKAMKAALEYEILRQKEEWTTKRLLLKDVGKVTRGYQEKTQSTILQRHKEESAEYRYFPEPDLKPILIDPAWVESMKSRLPELPAQKRKRFAEEWGLPELDIGKLLVDAELAHYFEAACKEYKGEPKKVANWVITEIGNMLNKESITIIQFREKVPPESLGELLNRIDSGVISGKMAKGIFSDMWAEGKTPEQIINEKGLKQIDDQESLKDIVREVLDQNPKTVEDYKNGKENVLSFLMGQVMKATRGKANPRLSQDLLKELLQK
ncbi:MAG: Asp-tRNA(Asn)/Glu-tRNA(Gln) amidotransferase subunit GatB [Spirochaetales bacterium]|nr:Asp-tRNA(Asn)/Glu-tRNA(Gln) amidotransferase subunit GatB [Spirochaetales bacterium]